MYKYKTEHICNTNINKLFDIILDIEKYPDFLPWCIAAIVKSKTKDDIYADLMVNFNGINEQYTSKVIFNRPYIINVTATNGPFKNLINIWELNSIDSNQTQLFFDIEFEFKSKILNNLVGLVYKKAANDIANAFLERAKFLTT